MRQKKTTLDWKLGPAQGMGAAGGGAGIRLDLTRTAQTMDIWTLWTIAAIRFVLALVLHHH